MPLIISGLEKSSAAMGATEYLWGSPQMCIQRNVFCLDRSVSNNLNRMLLTIVGPLVLHGNSMMGRLSLLSAGLVIASHLYRAKVNVSTTVSHLHAVQKAH